MAHTITEQTLALSALFLAASCVNQIAYTGRTNQDDFDVLINSIFRFDSPSTEAIYGSTHDLYTGYGVLVAQLEQTGTEADINVARIVITLLVLERKLNKNKTMQEQLFSGIEAAKQQAQHFDSYIHENVLANLASVYSDTISQLQPKVMVNGEQNYLNNQDNVNKVRSLLLAGIRAAVLFNQLGGRRWHLLFKRKKFIAAAKQLRANMTFH